MVLLFIVENPETQLWHFNIVRRQADKSILNWL